MQAVKYILLFLLLPECSLIQVQGMEGQEYSNDSALVSKSIRLNKSSRFTFVKGYIPWAFTI